MKYMFLLLFVAIICIADAQNYNCLQLGARPYFINGNNYLRSMRIDSVVASGSDTIFYPYHTPRGGYGSMDSNGSSWLGGHVIKQVDGTFLFNTIWHDTVIIKTQANTGDSWIFYEDITQRSYIATVVAADTMTISGFQDSVKIIQITADSAGISYPSDPVNNFEIILSQNHGFIQVFDLYTFPYRYPSDSTQVLHGADYYMDLVLNDLMCGCDNVGPNSPDSINSIFHLISFRNPRMTELFNYSVGEVIEYYTFSNNYADYTSGGSETIDTIAAKIFTDSSVIYKMNERGSSSSLFYPPPPEASSSSSNEYYIPLYPESYDTTYLIDTTVLPEEWGQGYFYHYFPKTNFSISECPDTLCIVDVNYIDYSAGSVIFESDIDGAFIGNNTTAYGLGYGIISVNYNNWSGPYSTRNFGYRKDSTSSCGGFTAINAVTKINLPSNEIHIFPNPAQDELNITGSQLIKNVTILNLTGQTIYTTNFSQNNIQISISSLPPGLYIIKTDGTKIQKFLKE